MNFRRMKIAYKHQSIIIGATLLLLSACSKVPDQDPKYVDEVNAWHAYRIERLRDDTGWLTLTGLFWLDEGKNTFGSDPSNDIVFPGESVPPFLGSFDLENGTVTLRPRPDAEITVDSRRVGTIQLRSDADDDETLMELGPLNWLIIKRGDRLGVRLRNRQNPTLTSFEGIDRYPVDSSWNVRAVLIPSDTPMTIDVPDVMGNVNKDPTPGRLEFTIEGRTYSLYPTISSNPKRWFLIFADETNDDETYGAGRFLYIDSADSTGHAMIDFNRSYNPPCAFTPFATCPLPPAGNRLPIAVSAGEKRYEGYEH